MYQEPDQFPAEEPEAPAETPEPQLEPVPEPEPEPAPPPAAQPEKKPRRHRGLFFGLGVLLLAGEGLHIVKLNLDDGVLVAEGRILAMEYVQENKPAKKGVFSGLFR